MKTDLNVLDPKHYFQTIFVLQSKRLKLYLRTNENKSKKFKYSSGKKSKEGKLSWG